MRCKHLSLFLAILAPHFHVVSQQMSLKGLKVSFEELLFSQLLFFPASWKGAGAKN
jgi:hypothetical protein